MARKPRTPEQPLKCSYPWLNTPAEGASEIGRDAPEIAPHTVAPVPRVCLSRPEAARALGIGVSTLKAMERTGTAPPAFEVPGGRRLYPVASLVQWAADRARGGWPAPGDSAGPSADA